MNFITVIVFALASGITPTLGWLEMIPIVAGFIVFATGIGMLLSALYVRYRDVQPIWEVLVQAWFYCSPVMYVATAYSNFGDNFQKLAMINPFATMLTQMGHAFIDPARSRRPWRSAESCPSCWRSPSFRRRSRSAGECSHTRRHSSPRTFSRSESLQNPLEPVEQADLGVPSELVARAGHIQAAALHLAEPRGGELGVGQCPVAAGLAQRIK